MFPLFCDLVAKNNVTVSPMKTLNIHTLENLEIEYSSLLEILPESLESIC